MSFLAASESLIRQPLACSFLNSAELVLRGEAKSKSLDISEAARRAAVRMVRMPAKASLCLRFRLSSSAADLALRQGATLLGLLNVYPSLVQHVRNEILRHKISLDLLQPADSADPTRPLYSTHKPSFLFPIAFDYEHAIERFATDLGPSPWVEPCYAADSPPCSPPSEFAESVWPIKPRHYHYGEGDERRDIEFVTGDSLEGTQGQGLADWTYERVPKGTLPVAFALLVSSSLVIPG